MVRTASGPRPIDSLILIEIPDMQVLATRDLIFDEQPSSKQFLYKGLALDVVVGENLSPELLRGAIKVAVIVREILRCDEE
jgi:hypothetical protein